MRKLKFRSMFIDDGNPNFTKLEDFYNLIDKTEFEIIEIENIVFIPFKIFNKLNLFLETTFLKKFALFNIVYLKKNS